MNTIQTAKVSKSPSSPIASKINPDEFRVNVEVQFDNAETERIYFTYGSDLDYLEPGDVVFVGQTRKGNKTITLTPELAARLKSRRESKKEERKPTTPAPAPEPEPKTPITPNDFMDIAEMALIFKALRREIPEASDECICSLAQSVFKYRRQI